MEEEREEKPKKTSTRKSTTKAKKNEKKETIKEKKVISKKSEKATKPKEEKDVKTKEEKQEAKQIVINDTDLSIDKSSQKSLKVLSRIISILAKIGRICLMIAVPFIFLIMIAIRFVVNKVEVDGNIIKFEDARFVINNEYVTFKVGDSKYVSNEQFKELEDIAKFLTDNSKGRVILFVESIMLFAGFTLVILIYIFGYIEKLFDNIYRRKTPFIEDNSKYIYNIGNLMIVNAIVDLVFGIVFELAYPKTNVVVGFKSAGLLEILVVFVIYYVFKYGVKLQEHSKSEIYS